VLSDEQAARQFSQFAELVVAANADRLQDEYRAHRGTLLVERQEEYGQVAVAEKKNGGGGQLL
jgi:glutamine synthetase adenylyltransferase